MENNSISLVVGPDRRGFLTPPTNKAGQASGSEEPLARRECSAYRMLLNFYQNFYDLITNSNGSHLFSGGE